MLCWDGIAALRALLGISAVAGVALLAAAGAAARPLATTDLSVVQAFAAPTGLVGDSLSFTITVLNGGPDPANSVVVRDALSGAKGTLTTVTPSKGQGCTLGTTKRTLRCVIGSLANGESATVTAVVSLAGPGTLTAAADVSGRETDPNQANQLSQVTADVTETTPPTGLTLSGTAFGEPFTPRPHFPISWHAVDNAGGSGIGGYDVRYRAAPPQVGFGPPRPWQTNTSATHAAFNGRPGYTYCFSFRATDKDGNASAWSGEKCAAVLLGAAAARRAGDWKASSSGSVHSRAAGATLSLPVVTARALYVDAVRCPGCGSLAVLWQGRLLRTLDLNARARGRAVLRVAAFPAVRRGTLALRVVRSKATVTVEAFGIAKR
jgi:uncharacterized repeat protein (TIGR01451 family)